MTGLSASTTFSWSCAEADFVAHRIDGTNHSIMRIPQLMTSEVVDNIRQRSVEKMDAFKNRGNGQWEY